MPLAFLLACSAVGCAPTRTAHDLICVQMKQFSPRLDEKQAIKLYHAWAELEWANICPQIPEPIRETYHVGFIDGFTDAVYAGGNGEPPIVPPRPFWRVLYRNAPGDEEIANWTRGFRHGANVALSGGYRRRALIPTSISLEGALGGIHAPHDARYETIHEGVPVETIEAPQSFPDSEELINSPAILDESTSVPRGSSNQESSDASSGTADRPVAPVQDFTQIPQDTPHPATILPDTVSSSKASSINLVGHMAEIATQPDSRPVLQRLYANTTASQAQAESRNEQPTAAIQRDEIGTPVMQLAPSVQSGNTKPLRRVVLYR